MHPNTIEPEFDTNLRVIREIALSHDAKHLAVVGDLGLFLIDASSLELEWQWNENGGASIYSVDFSVDDSKIAIGRPDAVIVLDTHTGKVVNQVSEGYFFGVNAIAWSPNDDYIAVSAVGFERASIKLFDPLSLELVETLPDANRFGVESMKWSPNGNYLATGSKLEREVIVWELDSGQKTYLEGEGIAVTDLEWSPNGSMLASAWAINPSYGGEPHSLVIWDTTNDFNPSFADVIGEKVFDIVWSPDGASIVASFDNDEIRRYSILTGELISKWEIPDSSQARIVWIENPNNILLGTKNGTVYLWDTSTGEAVGQFIVPAVQEE